MKDSLHAAPLSWVPVSYLQAPPSLFSNAPHLYLNAVFKTRLGVQEVFAPRLSLGVCSPSYLLREQRPSIAAPAWPMTPHTLGCAGEDVRKPLRP